MLEQFYDDLQVGEVWRSRGRTITETDVVMFAALSGDTYSLHTDREYAAKTPYGQRIAHGMLILSAMTGLWNMTPGVVAAFYGLDRVRFIRPTMLGDTIYMESELLEKKDRTPDNGLVVFKNEVKNQRDEVILSTVVRLLVNRRK